MHVGEDLALINHVLGAERDADAGEEGEGTLALTREALMRIAPPDEHGAGVQDAVAALAAARGWDAERVRDALGELYAPPVTAASIQRHSLSQAAADTRKRCGILLASDTAHDALVALTRVERHVLGPSPFVFSAPHGVHLNRDGQPSHKPEDWTTFIAKALAIATSSTALVWSEAERVKSELTRAADPANRDPNYALAGWDCPDTSGKRDDAVAESPWLSHLRHASQSVQRAARIFHIDIHGRRDPSFGDSPTDLDASDLDVGLGALRRADPRLADALQKTLAPALAEALSAATKTQVPVRTGGAHADDDPSVFVVNDAPKLSGDWALRGKADRCTMSAMGCALGLVSVQLELSRRLRLYLKDDAHALEAVAASLVAACTAVAKL